MYEFFSIQATEADNVTEPVTVVEAKAWANVDHTDDDNLITEMIKGARYDIEQYTGRKLVEHTVTAVVNTTCAERFSLPYGKATALTVTDDEDEPLDEDNYKQTATGLRVVSAGTYNISYTVGESNAALKELVKMLVAYRYNNRGDSDEGLPGDIQERANKYRLEWL